MALVAQRHGIELAGTTVHVVKEMVADPRRRIGALRTTITFPAGLSVSAGDRTLLEATARACPVEKSLGAGSRGTDGVPLGGLTGTYFVDQSTGPLRNRCCSRARTTSQAFSK